MEQIIEITKGANQTYFVFVLLILVINSLVKFIIDTKGLSIKKVVAVSSAFIIFIFWFFGAGFWKLIFCTFFTFGFFDWFWRYIERLYLFALGRIVELFQSAWQKIINRFKK